MLTFQFVVPKNKNVMVSSSLYKQIRLLCFLNPFRTVLSSTVGDSCNIKNNRNTSRPSKHYIYVSGRVDLMWFVRHLNSMYSVCSSSKSKMGCPEQKGLEALSYETDSYGWYWFRNFRRPPKLKMYSTFIICTCLSGAYLCVHPPEN